MSRKRYSLSERGGGKGETGRQRAAILRMINSWVGNAHWHNPDTADRFLQKLNEAPERFISPDPGVNTRKQASSIYAEIKDEYGLILESEVGDLNAEADEKADRYVREQVRETVARRRDAILSGDATDLLREIVADVGQKTVRDALETEGIDVALPGEKPAPTPAPTGKGLPSAIRRAERQEPPEPTAVEAVEAAPATTETDIFAELSVFELIWLVFVGAFREIRESAELETGDAASDPTENKQTTLQNHV